MDRNRHRPLGAVAFPGTDVYEVLPNAEVMHLTIDDEGVFHFTGGGDIAPAAQPGTPPRPGCDRRSRSQRTADR